MPIIEKPDPLLPLTQGDVLRDLRLFVTKEAWTETGGDSLKIPHRLCMVVSRPCVVGHKANVLVAALERFTDRVPRDIQTFEQILGFLTELRDGPDSPDVFYLGQLPDQEGRYGARLDSLHTIQLPREEASLREFTQERRIARLHIDFARDLHLRMFRAFASLGFDDQRWLSTEDLRWLVAQGRSEVTAAESRLREGEAALHSARAQGFKNDSERQQLEKAVTTALESLAGQRSRVAPFEVELGRRHLPPTLPLKRQPVSVAAGRLESVWSRCCNWRSGARHVTEN